MWKEQQKEMKKSKLYVGPLKYQKYLVYVGSSCYEQEHVILRW